MPKVMRHMLREYYGTPAEAGGAVAYHYVNKGFTQLDEEGGAQVETEAYIGDRNASTTITGYENTWAYNTQYISDEAVCKDIVDIARYQKTGSDAERDLVSIDMSEEPVSEGVYKARHFKIAVEAGPPQGDPRSVTTSEGTFHQLGDMEEGTFSIATNIFTPDEGE